MAGFYDFNLAAADGTTVSMADLKGKVVLIVEGAAIHSYSSLLRSLTSKYDAEQPRTTFLHCLAQCVGGTPVPLNLCATSAKI